jgi:predicted kinase
LAQKETGVIMKTCILMAGIPGSGKSTWAKNFAKSHPNTFIVDTDETRKKITGSYLIFPSHMEIIFDEMIKEANEALANTKGDGYVIIDSTFLDDWRRNYYLDRLKGYDRIVLHMIKMHDYSLCYERNHQRIKEKWVPEEVMAKMIASYVDPSPAVAKRFDEITVSYEN